MSSYNLVTTDNGVTVNETPLLSIEQGKEIIIAIAKELKSRYYNPLITHRGTCLTYHVEEIDDLGATVHYMFIGIESAMQAKLLVCYN